ncbi:MAG: hypothetical protein ACLGGV_06040 [Bacteroidia bacterium]
MKKNVIVLSVVALLFGGVTSCKKEAVPSPTNVDWGYDNTSAEGVLTAAGEEEIMKKRQGDIGLLIGIFDGDINSDEIGCYPEVIEGRIIGQREEVLPDNTIKIYHKFERY